MNLAAELDEFCRDQIGRAPLGEGQFGMGVDIPADRRQLVLIVAHLGDDRHRPLPVRRTACKFITSMIERMQM